MAESDAPVLNYQTPKGLKWTPLSRYRSVRRVGVGMVALIAAATFVSLVEIVFLYRQIDLLQAIMSGHRITLATAHRSDLRIQAGAALQVILFIIGATLWLIWFRRVYVNLPLITGEPTKFTPRWAIVAYFIPFLNLIRIPQTLLEAFKGSDTSDLPHGAVVVTWWLCWMAAGIVAKVAENIVARVPGERPNLKSLITGSWTFMLDDSLRVLAGVLAIFLIMRISNGQAAKYRTIG